MPDRFLEGNAGETFLRARQGPFARSAQVSRPRRRPRRNGRPKVSPQHNPTWSFWRPIGRVKCGVGSPSHSARFRRTAKSRH